MPLKPSDCDPRGDLYWNVVKLYQRAEELRAKYPNRRSACGLFLAEVLKGEDIKERDAAACALWILNCERGVRQLTPIAFRLAQDIEARGSEEGLGSPERHFLKSILWAVANIDTPQSHVMLVSGLEQWRDPWIRGDVLEVMSNERRVFDKDLVASYLSPIFAPPEISSALYTMSYTDYVTRFWRDALTRVAPLLRHENWYVRYTAIELLRDRSANRDLILSLANDTDGRVQTAVKEAIEFIDNGYSRFAVLKLRSR